MFELRPYQHEGIAKFATNNRFFNFDDPGMGKTVQAIHAADKVKAKRVLISVPANIVIQWQKKVRELQKTDFIADVVSYNKLTDRAEFYKKQKYDVCIIDEGHYLKNRKAKRTKSLYGNKTDAVAVRMSWLALFRSPVPLMRRFPLPCGGKLLILLLCSVKL